MERMRAQEPAGGWRNPWPQAFEIAHELPADRWALVGGLMVQAHALAAGIETTRVTVGVDVAVRIDAGASPTRKPLPRSPGSDTRLMDPSDSPIDSSAATKSSTSWFPTTSGPRPGTLAGISWRSPEGDRHSTGY